MHTDELAVSGVCPDLSVSASLESYPELGKILSHSLNSEPICLSMFAEQLNQVRLTRAQALLPPAQRHLMQLIAPLFHYHSKTLPGYNGPLTPRGIQDYQHNEAIFEAFTRQDLTLPHEPLINSVALLGIYSMGSTGSFGQKHNSDIDVWLVHQPQLFQVELEQLKEKANILSRWFGRYQLEVNFYLVHPEQFISETQLRGPDLELGHEHSGSAQHWLLLEEFYRSQIRLAGKTVAWWPSTKPHPNLLYLGDVHQVPASEYFGAALWQLYKGLEKPHKALLKVLLLEVYASCYPNTQLISDVIWQQTMAGDFSPENDHYFLLYDVIERYLLKRQDHRRLELVRRCFYLKCGVHLTCEQQPTDWRYQKLKTLVNSWGWQTELQQMLDNCQFWHSGQLEWFNRQLNELMLGSYQTLLQFAASHQLTSVMRIDELGMLTRKLHTYFNDDSRQLIRFNPLWSQSIAESRLVIYQDNGFCLMRMSNDDRVTDLLYQGSQLALLLYWACINGVATEQTLWYRSHNRRLSLDKHLHKKVRQMLAVLRDCNIKVSKQDLCNPWHFRQVLCLLNLEQDPTCDWRGQELMVDRMNANVFSLGRKQQNMLGSIDVLCINNWGEYHCHHFEGEQALLKALEYAAPGLKRAGENVRLNVICHAKRLESQLSHAVLNLLKQLIRLSQHEQTSTTLLQPLLIEQTRYGLFYNTQGMAWQDLSDAKSLYQQIVKGQVIELPRPILSREPLAALPEVVQNYATIGVIQYFLRQQGQNLDVFVLDELNHQRHFVQQNSNIATLVASISHQFVFDEHHTPYGRFNLPQFFRLECQKDGALTLAPFGISPEEMTKEF